LVFAHAAVAYQTYTTALLMLAIGLPYVLNRSKTISPQGGTL